MNKNSLVAFFAGEKWLVMAGLFGFVLAGFCAVYIALNGSVVLPEGNVQSAFSFNAAIGIFILSVAALMPLAGLSERKRIRLRWGFIAITLIGYGIETIQHLRGINPRYTQVGSLADVIAGGIFGLISLLLIVVTVQLAVAFFRRNQALCDPLLLLGIRYAFLSTMLAFASGVLMIVLQSRYLGSAGNFIVLHGLGFHAIQALPFVGWLLERTRIDEKRKRTLLHIGSIAWMISILAIGLQTFLGRTTFEWSLLPLLAAVGLLVWLSTLIVALWWVLKPQWASGGKRTAKSEQSSNIV